MQQESFVTSRESRVEGETGKALYSPQPIFTFVVFGRFMRNYHSQRGVCEDIMGKLQLEKDKKTEYPFKKQSHHRKSLAGNVQC